MHADTLLTDEIKLNINPFLPEKKEKIDLLPHFTSSFDHLSPLRDCRVGPGATAIETNHGANHQPFVKWGKSSNPKKRREKKLDNSIIHMVTCELQKPV